MAENKNSYKNVYLIDIDRIKNKVSTLLMGNTLPVIDQNATTQNDTPTFKVFSERCVRKCIGQYNILSAALGNTTARTIIEYLDKSGKPLVTLYPTNDIDVHNNDWTNLSTVAFDDLHKTIQERTNLIKQYKKTVLNR